MARRDEEIRHKSEWQEDDGANILHIHVPGFRKEQLKISYVHTTRIIRVTGERQIAGNKWNRFNQTYAVPRNCDVDNIRARFANETLTVTMPKFTLTPATPPKQEPKPATTQEPITPAKPAYTTPPAQVSQEATAEPKEQEGFKAPALQEVFKDSKPQKGQEYQMPDQASKWEDALGAPSSSKLGYTTSKQSSLAEQYLEEIGKRRKATEMEEDRQTMINVGVALLVAVAFGAYLYYSYRSPGNAQE